MNMCNNEREILLINQGEIREKFDLLHLNVPSLKA